MADATVGTLKYRFEADVSGLKTGIAQANDNLKQLSANAADMGKKASSAAAEVGNSFKAMSEKVADAAYELGPWTGQHVDLAKASIVGLQGVMGTVAIAAAAFSAAVVVALGAIAAHAVKMGEAAEHAKSQFDLTGDGVAKLSTVASRAGTDLDTLASALLDVSKNARNEDDDLIAAAKAVGLSADQLKTKDLPGLLRTLQVAYSQTGDSANKYAAFQKILGDSFEKLYPVMQQGVGYMDRLYEAAMRSGTAITGTLSTAMTNTIGAVRNAGSAWTEFKESVNGAVLALYEKFSPAIDLAIRGLTTLIERMTTWVQGFTEAVRQSYVLSAAIDVVTFAVKALASALVLAGAGFDVILAAAQSVMEQVKNLVNGGITVIDEFWKAITFQGGKPVAALGGIGDGAVQAAKDAAEKIKGIYTKAYADIGKIWEQPKAPDTKNLRVAGNPDKPDTGGGGKTKAERDPHEAIDKYIEGLKEAQALAQVEADTWNKSNVERKVAVDLVKAKSIAEREGITLTEKDTQAITAAATATAQLKDQTEALKKAQEDLKNSAKQWADTFANALDDIIIKGKKAGDVFKDLLKTMASMSLKNTLTGGKDGGILGGLFGGLGDMFKSFVGGRATGGPIGAGQWGLVGENGPEFISGGSTGVQITPFGKAGAASGPPTIVQHYNISGAITQNDVANMVRMGVRQGISSYDSGLLGRIDEKNRRAN